MKNIILLSTFFLGLIMFLSACNDKKAKDQVEKKIEAESQNAKSPSEDRQISSVPNADPQYKNPEVSVDTILGRWLRPDGNYVIQINSIDKNNQIDAQYFNPNPIKVARAELIADDNFRIFIEFDDEGYKGSSYDLIYDPLNDALTGKYFQATYGQTYQIGFIRLKE